MCSYSSSCVYKLNAFLVHNACWSVTEQYSSNHRAVHCVYSSVSFFTSSKMGQTCSFMVVSAFVCMFVHLFLCVCLVSFSVVGNLGFCVSLLSVHPAGWLPCICVCVFDWSLTTRPQVIPSNSSGQEERCKNFMNGEFWVSFTALLYSSHPLTLSKFRSDWWLHRWTGSVGGSVASEGRVPAEPRARAAGEAFQLQRGGRRITFFWDSSWPDNIKGRFLG